MFRSLGEIIREILHFLVLYLVMYLYTCGFFYRDHINYTYFCNLHELCENDLKGL